MSARQRYKGGTLSSIHHHKSGRGRRTHPLHYWRTMCNLWGCYMQRGTGTGHWTQRIPGAAQGKCLERRIVGCSLDEGGSSVGWKRGSVGLPSSYWLWYGAQSGRLLCGSGMSNENEVTPMRPLAILRHARLAITLSVDEIACITGCDRWAPGLVSFVPAVAYHFWLNLLAAFTELGACLLEDPCKSG